jgi:hypothetical protein
MEGVGGDSLYMALGAIGTALDHPTRRTEPPHSNPSSSRRACSASFRFMNETKPLRPELFVRLELVMSAPGPAVPSVRGHIILTCRKK